MLHLGQRSVELEKQLSRLRSYRARRYEELSTDEIINLDRGRCRARRRSSTETKRPKRRAGLHVKYVRNENCQWPDTADWLGATAR